jgi:quercetin dioxygenase-like cupin family protein
MVQWMRGVRVLIRRLLGVAVCCSVMCAAQQRADDLPVNYKTELTKSFVKVIRVHYGPHEKVPVHDHPATPTVYVYLNNSGPVRITHFDGDRTSSLVRPPTHTGAFRVSPGQLERHSVENLSDLPSEFLRVELPGFALGDKELEFRGKAPDDLSHDLSAVEFATGGLTVSRTICVDAAPCEVERPTAQSVVIAFSDVLLNEGGAAGKRTELKLGDALAVPAGVKLSVSGAAREPAHVLVVSVQDARPAQ